MDCHTDGCIRTAKYMIVEEKHVHRYCLTCIQKIKERELVKS
jgi:hypothetical protein